MADIELRFIAALLGSSKQMQDAFYARSIPRGVFKLRPQEAEWIYEHRNRYGVYPSRLAFKAKFEALPFVKDPLFATLQLVLDEVMLGELRQTYEKVRELVDSGKPATQVIEFHKAASQQLNIFTHSAASLSASDSGAIARYAELVREKARPKSSLFSFPWPSMNKLLGVLRAGEYVVLCARTSIGKTWAALAIAHQFALAGISVLFVSKELVATTVQDRLDALRFKLCYPALREGTLSIREFRRWKRERRLAAHKPYPLTIVEDGDPILTLSWVEGQIEQLQPRVVIIDGAYFLPAEGVPKSTPKHERLAWVSNKIQSITKTKKVLSIAVVQMGRGAEKNGGGAGKLEDVFGSDAFAQDCDVLIEVKGQRGAIARSLGVLKARESNIGEVNIRFQLDPYPDFAETVSGAPTGGGKATFKGLS